MSFEYDLVIVAGATLRRSFTWYSDGAPVDLTNWEGLVHGRSAVGAEDIAFTLSTGDGSIVLGNEGEIDFYLTPVQTALIDLPLGVWDLSLKNPDGDVMEPLIYGKAQTHEMVTEWP